MDPRIAATILTILLYTLSAQNHKPSDAVVQPPVGAYEVEAPGEALAPPSAGPDRPVPSGKAPDGGADRNAGKDPPKTPVEPGGQASVTERARLRKGPGTSYATVLKLDPGTNVTLLAHHSGWYQVRLPGGRVGWIADFLLHTPTPSIGGSGQKLPSSPPIASSKSGTRAREVLGFYTEDYHGDPTSYGSLLRGSNVIDSIATFLHPVDSGGRVSGQASRKAMNAAASSRIRTLALVHNLTPSGFDEKRAHALVQTFNSRARAISDILAILDEGGYDGVNIDLENVRPGDRENLTAFMTELAAKLRPRGYLVTMSMPAKTADHVGASWVGAFDYYALGRACDSVTLMTYDEHTLTSGPGPVASYTWVEKVISYAITQIPRHKILLGIPAYGYDWNLATGRVTALSYTQAMNRAKRLGIDPSWDSAAKSPHFSYVENGTRHEVWFESSHSIGPKLDLVNKYDLGGIAIWKLGYEDDAYWEVIRQKLKKGSAK